MKEVGTFSKHKRLNRSLVQDVIEALVIRSEVLNLSLSYRYARPDWSQEKNLEVYGQDASALGLGGNFKVTVEATADFSLNDLRPLKETLDHKCLFEDVDWFKARPNTLENFTVFAAENLRLTKLFSGDWSKLTVQESRDLRAIWDFKAQKLALEFRARFPMQWKTPTGWGGGEWEAWVRMAAPVDPETGLMLDRAEAKNQIMSVCQRQSRQVHSVEGDITPLVNEVGIGFKVLEGFQGVEISVNPAQTFRLY